MDKRSAVLALAKGSRAIISVELAKQIADGCGVSFNMLLYIEPELVTTNGNMWLVKKEVAGREAVQVSELAATICRYMGLYADKDHAHQSPNASAAKMAEYVGQRSSVRLARELLGEDGVRDLIKECPEIPEAIKIERVFKV